MGISLKFGTESLYEISINKLISNYRPTALKTELNIIDVCV